MVYQLLRLPLVRFDPKAPAPATAAKKQMIEDNRSDFETWAEGVMADAATNSREVTTSKELAADYAISHPGRSVSQRTVTTTFRKLGAFASPLQVRLPNGSRVRPLALARISYWKQQASDVWTKEASLLKLSQ